MKRQLALLATIALLASCSDKEQKPADKGPTTPATAPTNLSADSVGDGTQVQIGTGDRRELAFEITEVHSKQKPSEASPWHEDGGEWTYLLAKTRGATFTFGFKSQPLEGVPFERATAMLSVDDEASVRALVTELAATLGVKDSPSIAHSGKPLEIPGAVLGRDQGRTPSGYGGSGNWITCKWTIEGTDAKGEPDAAEIYINFNLAEKRGVFSEKDEIYNAFLIESLATRL